MASTRLKIDVSALRRAGITRAKELRSALDEAVLYLAASARKRLREVAVQVLDRPMEFTVDAFKYRPVPGDAPAALVYVLPTAARYLARQVFGGEREPGDYGTVSRGILVPGRDAVLDEFGNMPRSQVSEAEAEGARWTPTRGSAQVLILPGRDRPRIIAAAEDVAVYEPRLPFYDVVEEVVRERGPGALQHVLRR
ncbi:MULTISPECIES: hypothetical protein [Methylobacteriaceae]|nr:MULTISPECIES: hypothetical protein [Methylobacteriaceae]MDQ0520070.1 hypothetical protein [Methylobacterium gregans]